MPTAGSAKISYESSQTEVSYAAMTDSGDHTVYNFDDDLISNRSGYEATIRPDGVYSGSNMLTVAVSGTNDLVDCAAFTAYFAGASVSVSADTDISCTRGASSSLNYIINSVVCNSSGVLSVVVGTGHDTAFNEVRGSAGGPPSITIGSIEVGQIRFTSETAGAVLATEIKQSVEAGQVEYYNYPLWKTPNTIGAGNKASVTAKENAYVEFSTAIPMIHGATPTSAATAYKVVYAHYYTPIFVSIDIAVDFVPAENTPSVSSTQYYNVTVGSKSTSLGTASFTALMTDGITDQLKILANENLIFKFWPDRNKAPYSVTQGELGVITAYPVADQISGAFTIAAELETVGFDS